MDLVIDGIIFEKRSRGGIARVFTNILPLMCDLDPKLKVKIFFTKTPRHPYPKHKQISTFLPENIHKIFRPWRVWHSHYPSLQKKCLRLWIGNTQNKIWLSTYFTRPPLNWKGSEVVLVHDLIYELYPQLMPQSDIVIKDKKECIMAADKVICNSNTTIKDLQKYYPEGNDDITAIHLSQDELFTKRSQDEIKNLLPYRYILYVGGRSYYKSFDTLLQAYSNWAWSDQIKLVVVGSDWSEEELNQISAKGLDLQIILLKNIEDNALCDLYNQAEGFIYPSLYEGFGIPLLEAMACGCPVIASRIPSTEEVAGNVPIYFEPGDVSGLQDALDQLICEEGTQERIKKGMEKATQYSWKKTAKMFYQELKKFNETN